MHRDHRSVAVATSLAPYLEEMPILLVNQAVPSPLSMAAVFRRCCASRACVRMARGSNREMCNMSYVLSFCLRKGKGPVMCQRRLLVV